MNRTSGGSERKDLGAMVVRMTDHVRWLVLSARVSSVESVKMVE